MLFEASAERILSPLRTRFNVSGSRVEGVSQVKPKKLILLVGVNEHEVSPRKFLLETRGPYFVTSFSQPLDLIDSFKKKSPVLVIADFVMSGMIGDELTRRLKEIDPTVPIILIGDPPRYLALATGADALLSKKEISSAVLLERARQMCARKRGQRKGIFFQSSDAPDSSSGDDRASVPLAACEQR